jgi:hypothetical protein
MAVTSSPMAGARTVLDDGREVDQRNHPGGSHDRVTVSPMAVTSSPMAGARTVVDDGREVDQRNHPGRSRYDPLADGLQ